MTQVLQKNAYWFFLCIIISTWEGIRAISRFENWPSWICSFFSFFNFKIFLLFCIRVCWIWSSSMGRWVIGVIWKMLLPDRLRFWIFWDGKVCNSTIFVLLRLADSKGMDLKPIELFIEVLDISIDFAGKFIRHKWAENQRLLEISKCLVSLLKWKLSKGPFLGPWSKVITPLQNWIRSSIVSSWKAL